MMTLQVILGGLRLSLRRLFWSMSMLANTGLALLPVVIIVLVVLLDRDSGVHTVAQVHARFEYILRILYLHFIVFFIASLAGFAVMRQDLEEQTLHYLLLSPAPRWGILTGKVLAFLGLAGLLCTASLWASYLTMAFARCPAQEVMADLVKGGRLLLLVRESLVLLLGLLAYGSIAMLMGSIFKSGFYAIVLLGWESALPYLPSTLKQWTVMHYLQSLLPERPQEAHKLFELLGDPASLLASIVVPLVVSLIFIAIGVAIFQTKECRYGEA